MSRPDSERALKIYKTFTTQTEEVVKFLGVARHFEAATRLEIPKLKHASTDLTRLLEDDLSDPDFDLRRREYLTQKDGKSGTKPMPSLNKAAPRPAAGPQSTPNRPQTAPQPEKKPNQPDLIDFFESIEPVPPMGQPAGVQQNNFQQQPQMQFQQTGFQQQQPGFYSQQTGYQQTTFGGAQDTNFYGQQAQQPMQATPTGAGFGGYSTQPQSYGYQSSLAPIPQSNVASFPQQQQQSTGQQQTTNPFRQSMMLSTPTGGSPAPATPLTRQNTNPFAKRLSSANPQFTGSQQSPSGQTQQPAPLQPQRTGTNPFARASSVPPQQQQQHQPPAPLQPTLTGTNPFRQSSFINQQTGQGWQVSGQHGTMGGLEQLNTVPIFPRPGMS